MTELQQNHFYKPSQVFMHWFMLLLLVLVSALVELKSYVPRGSALRSNMLSLHYVVGLCIFALVWVRLFLRSRHSIAPVTPTPPMWQQRVASMVQVLLYALMIGLPLLGWLALSAKGKPVNLFGLDLPFLIAQDEPLAKQIKWWHETLATVGYGLVGLHAAAALFHHYRLRDNALWRMLPQRWR